MTILNSATLRNNLAQVLETVAQKKEPVLIGRFGQPKAILIDVTTYHWQKQIVDLAGRIDSLTKPEIETLEILLDEKTRKALSIGLNQVQKGELVTLDKFLES